MCLFGAAVSFSVGSTSQEHGSRVTVNYMCGQRGRKAGGASWAFTAELANVDVLAGAVTPSTFSCYKVAAANINVNVVGRQALLGAGFGALVHAKALRCIVRTLDPCTVRYPRQRYICSD